MLFNYKDQVYILHFEYDESPNGERVTTAKFFSYDRDTEEKILIAKGFSYCQPQDQFVKKVGRRIAVERLIENLDGYMYDGYYRKEARNFRTEFWNAYHMQSPIRKIKD